MKDTKSDPEQESPAGLESRRILAELVALAREFSIDVQLDRGDFATSLCRIRGKTVVYINTNEALNRAAEVIADALAGQDLDTHYILPEVRALLEGKAVVTTGPDTPLE